MATHTIIQEEDTTLTLTADVLPLAGSILVWAMIDRVTKEAVLTNSQTVGTPPSTTVTITITSANTTDYKGAYYYELWEHRPAGTPMRMLDTGTVIITATYAGDVS